MIMMLDWVMFFLSAMLVLQQTGEYYVNNTKISLTLSICVPGGVCLLDAK